MKILDYFRRTYSGWQNLDAFHGNTDTGGTYISEATALSIPAVYACIRVLSEAISSLPLLVYERFPGGDKERASNFSLYRLLHDEPNSLMTSMEYRELMVSSLCLRGNFYSYIEREDGEIINLWPLPTDSVTPEVTGREIIYKTNDRVYQQEDILHVKGLSSDGIVGLSPLSVLRDTFARAKGVSDYSSAFFRNNAAPSGILSTPNTLSVQSLGNLTQMWNQQHQGAQKAHKTAVLDSGLTWQPISISPEDSQLIESMKFSVIDIARCFRVPLNLLMDYDRSTYSNVTEQNRSFLTHTLQPWLCRIEESLTKSLLTESEKNRYEIEHLTQGFLRGDTKTRYESYQIGINAGFLKIDEIRKMENLNSLPKPEVAP